MSSHYCVLLIVLLIPACLCAPVPGRSRASSRDGLILGPDFLSLFIHQQQKSISSTERTRSTEVTPEVTSEVTQDVTPGVTTEVTAEVTTEEPPVTPSQVQVSVRVSSSMSKAPTTPADVFTTFLDAFSKTSQTPTPSESSNNRLIVEEPTFGTRLTARRQFSDSKSTSQRVTVRYTPKTTPMPPPQDLEPPEHEEEEELSDHLYRENEKNYADTEKNYSEMKFAESIRVLAKPEKLYDKQEQVYSYGQQNNEVPETATPAVAEGLQVFDKTLVAERAAASQKFGYVVEGRNYRKYRVEERTPDGFIVGEYGVVSHDDGQLRGVRYTADSTINPKLIYDALMNFLKL